VAVVRRSSIAESLLWKVETKEPGIYQIPSPGPLTHTNLHHRRTLINVQRYRIYTGNETNALPNGLAPDYQAVLV
jgi:hypothetical protein